MVIRVALVDDDAEVLELLTALLSTDPVIDCVWAATTGREAVALTDRHRPDVLVLDIQLAGSDGLDIAEEVRRRHPRQHVVMLTTFGERAYIRRAVSLGVDGFLLKSGDPVDLLRGIRAVHGGGVCLAPPVAAMITGELRRTLGQPEAEQTSRLSPRQRDVLGLLASGLSNAEIGAELHVSEATVKGYVSALFVQLGVRNRVEAALVHWRGGH